MQFSIILRGRNIHLLQLWPLTSYKSLVTNPISGTITYNNHIFKHLLLVKGLNCICYWLLLTNFISFTTCSSRRLKRLIPAEKPPVTHAVPRFPFSQHLRCLHSASLVDTLVFCREALTLCWYGSVVGTRRIDSRVPFTICQHFPGLWHEVDTTSTSVCGWGGWGMLTCLVRCTRC